MARARFWFCAAVGVQLAILALVPAQKLGAVLFGRTIVLRTRPVDPYDIMSGYYVTLSYDISRPRGMPSVQDGETVYVVLVEGRGGVWEARSAHAAWPGDVPEGAVVIRGRAQHRNIDYGIESYYIPEEMRDEIEDGLRRLRGRAKVEVKVGPLGGMHISRLLVGDRVYDY